MAEGVRARIEARFEIWGRFVARRPLPVLAASVALALVFGAGLPRVEVDVTFEAFLGQGDPVLIAYEAFRSQFGRDERAIVSASPGTAAGSQGVFDLAFLEKLRALHEAIEERVPYLVEVTSLVNARDTRGEGDTLVVGDFLDPWPDDAASLARLRERALKNELFRNNVISADGGITTLVLELQLYSSVGEVDELAEFDEADAGDDPPAYLSGAETGELVAALHDVVDEFQRPDFVLHLAGSPVMIQDVATSMARDMPRFVVLALISIAGLLFLLFRRVVAVVGPLLVVVLSLAATIGLMGWTGTSIHVPTQILPTFLLAVGVGDAVHLLSIFFQRIHVGEERTEALAHALGHSGLAIVLTSLTTAGGLASFIGSGVAPVAAIGVFAPFGVMVALFLSLTLLPAILSIVPLGASRAAPVSKETNAIDRLLGGWGRFSTRNARGVVGAARARAGVAGVGASRLAFSHDPLSWLDPELDIVKGTRFIDQALGGSVSFEVLLEMDSEGGARDPKTLRSLARLGSRLEKEERDGLVAAQTVSLADVVKEIHRALNEDRDDAYRIPDDRRLVSQELLLFENSGTDDLEDVVDTRYRLARIAVRMPWRDAIHYTDFFDLAEADVHEALSDVGSPSTTGVLALIVRAISTVVTSMASSYLLAFAVITPLMVLLLGSLRLGLLAMLPNVMPILLTLGVMGFLGLPLDTFSLLLGGIALGLAVDDTIHFMHNYQRYRAAGASLGGAVGRTLHTAGRAMLITTIVLSTGFLGFVLSSMNNLANMGLLVSFTITTAFFSDVLLAPALLALFDTEARAKAP
jgi:predicted RND superfamily exporter protein